MYTNNFRVVTIADIHYGKKDDIKLTNELKEIFFKEIMSMELNYEEPHIDLIVIAGDLFDRVIRMNEYSAKLVMDFVGDLCEFCHENSIQLRILKGTKTHDFNQLQVFHNLRMKYSNFEIVNNVGKEDLVVSSLKKPIKILYLPEEYPDNFNKYYGDYLEDTYDIIFGHGMIDFVAYTGDESDSERFVRNAPVWKSETLMNICNGPIIFGHIHDMKEYKDKIYYCGSYSRYSFADQEDKGFLVFDINMDDTSKYDGSFIENTLAPTYHEIDISELNGMSSEVQLAYINKMKKQYDFIKIRANKNNKENLDLIKNILQNEEDIKIDIKNVSVDDEKVPEEYMFIIRKEYDPYETVSRFAKLKHNKNIPTSYIKELFEKLRKESA